MGIVLVADDDRRVRAILSEALAHEGHETLEASDGAEALSIIASRRPATVLLDLDMPGLRGEEVMLKAREMDDPPDIIIVTGQGSLESATLAVRYHARDYIAKPFDLPVVVEKVNQSIAERGAREALREQARASEAQLRETEAEVVRGRTFVQGVLAACGDAIVVSGVDGRVLLANEALRGLCGIGPEEAVGRPVDELIAEGDWAAHARQTLARGGIGGRELCLVHRGSGRRSWVRATVRVLPGESGEPIGYVTALHDVTENRMLLEELQDANQRLLALSLTDSVTGIHNHRHFQERLRSELQEARRYRYPLSLVMLDLDDFKQLNDTHGHLAGDRVLRTVAEAARKVLRETDVLCRYGGEEFAAILPHTDKARGTEAAERLRAAISTATVATAEATVRVTASFGVATSPDDGETPQELVNAADAAMYRAKRAGKDRVSS